MELPDRLNAEWCARVIVAWHVTKGIEEAPHRLPPEMVEEYREIVSRVSQLDLRSPEAQLKVAHLQRSGIFEWAYPVPIPEEYLAALQLAAWPSLRVLGEAARFAIEELRTRKEQGRRQTVNQDEMFAKAEVFYAEYRKEEHLGIGGMGLLLSCSLERTHDSVEFDLLSPEILGLQKVEPGSRPNDFLDCLRKGQLQVKEITGAYDNGLSH